MLLVDETFFDKLLSKVIEPTIAKSVNSNEMIYFNSISELLNKQVTEANKWLNTDEARRYFYHEQEMKEDFFNSIDESISDVLADKKQSVDEHIQALYNIGAKNGCNELNRNLVFTDADKKSLQYLQDYNFELISNVSNDLKEGIRETIWTNVFEGKSIPSTSKEIMNLPDFKGLGESGLTAKQRATMIARTETSRAVNTGTLQSYANYGVGEVDILTAGDNSVCKQCSALEKDNPHKIKLAQSLIPAHPLCRCAYTARITCPEDLSNDVVQKPIIVNPVVGEEEDKPKISYDDLKTPQEVADYYGYEFKPTYGGMGNSMLKTMEFVDKEYGCSIKFDEYFTKGVGATSYLDITSSGKRKYDLKEVMKIYSEAPPILKHASNEINITRKSEGASRNIFASAAISDDKITKTKIIKVLPLAFNVNKHRRGNVAQVLYHEMGHCLDYSYMPKEKADEINKVVRDGGLEHTPQTPEESVGQSIAFLAVASDEIASLSKNHFDGHGDENLFRKAQLKDNEHQLNNDFPQELASAYGRSGGVIEDFAEVISMASFDKLDKSRAYLVNYSNFPVPYEEWIKMHPNKYNYGVDLLNTLTKEKMTLK